MEPIIKDKIEYFPSLKSSCLELMLEAGLGVGFDVGIHADFGMKLISKLIREYDEYIFSPRWRLLIGSRQREMR